MSYQKVILQGNLTKDAEVRQVGNSQVALICVATSERYKKADGTIAEETEFHDVEIWNMAGVTPYLTKGASVLVEGRIKTDKWNDNQGVAHEKKKIRADVLRLCGPRPQAAAPAPQAAPQYGGQPAPQYGAAPAPQPQYAQVPQPPQPQYAPAPAAAPAPQYGQQPAPPAPQPQYQQAPTPPAGTTGGTDDLPFL